WPRAGAAWIVLLLVMAVQGPQVREVQATAPAHISVQTPVGPIQGAPWAWGSNEHGELGSGTTTNSAVPVAVSGLAGVVAMAAGTGHSLALTSGGTVWSWGDNYYGQLGTGLVCDPITGANCSSNRPVAVSGLSGVVVIAAGSNHNLALTSAGTV